jgi:hypothetical protein
MLDTELGLDGAVVICDGFRTEIECAGDLVRRLSVEDHA